MQTIFVPDGYISFSSLFPQLSFIDPPWQDITQLFACLRSLRTVPPTEYFYVLCVVSCFLKYYGMSCLQPTYIPVSPPWIPLQPHTCSLFSFASPSLFLFFLFPSMSIFSFLSIFLFLFFSFLLFSLLRSFSSIPSPVGAEFCRLD